MQELLSIIYPCSRTLYKHWAFCPCLFGKTWECFWAPLRRYSCWLHPILSREQTQLQASPLHPMQWKPPLMVQEVTAKCPCCSPDLDREYVPGANLPHPLQTTFVAEADHGKAFINTSFIVPPEKNDLYLVNSLFLQSCLFFFFFPEDLDCISDWPRLQNKTVFCRCKCSAYLQILQ